ncbi:MAG: hypothetical protein WAU58_20280 [Terriglobales bacterium]
MKKRIVSAETPPVNRLTRIGTLAAWASLGSFFYYLRQGDILMLGDAVAHINIARRVFDSLNPGPLQLGTVWLPLPHLLMIPFLLSDKMWQSGIGGSIPSMTAYVLGVIGIFRLTTGLLEDPARVEEPAPSRDDSRSPMRTQAAQLGGFIAAFVYAANPNLLYMQATALTEPLALAFYIWAMVYFADFAQAVRKGGWGREVEHSALHRCAACVACAELTRYDGWFLAGILGALTLVIARQRWNDRALRWSALKFLVGISMAPILWLVYNAAVYGNALAFAKGPYSAKAIAARVHAPNPAAHNLWAAASYFLKSAQITLAVGNWGRFWLLAAVVATALVAWRLRKQTALAVVILLWSPVAFYSLSIAYGSVILHVPMWWPFAIFNQRFGLELLPLFAVSAGVLVAGVAGRFAVHQWKVVTAAVALIIASYAFVWVQRPLCWQEAWRNWEVRRGLDTAVELAVKELPPHSIFLMDTDEHVGIMERLGIPLRRVVNNQDTRPWIHPADTESIWERALRDPGKNVNYVIAFDGDLVDKGVNRGDLTLLEVIHSSGQPPARIYQTRLAMNQSR